MVLYSRRHQWKSATNLYGISFVDNPDNNPTEAEVGLRIPPLEKLGQQILKMVLLLLFFEFKFQYHQ
jgi:hypothetical protein